MTGESGPRAAPEILVTGATGYIGGRLVPKLLEAGRSVRVFVRDARKLERASWRGDVEIAVGDVLEPTTLGPALAGVKTAYYLVHSLGAAAGDFEARDVLAAEGFARACREAGVARIIYLGGLGARDEDLSPHLRSRQATGAALRSSGVPVVELRAAVIVGSGSVSFEIIRDLAKKLPVMICPRWVRSRCEPISVRDVLVYLVGVLSEPRVTAGVYEIGGGEVLTYADMLRQCAEVMGRRVRILTLPVLTPRLSSYWLNLVTSVPMRVARPLIEGLRNDVVTTDRRLREWIPTEPTTYREAVERAVKRGEKKDRLTSRWTAAVGRPVRMPDARSLMTDRRELSSPLVSKDLFARVERIGGDAGWYYADWLWALRAAVDRLLGGPGTGRGRSHPTELAVGEPVGFWRVADLEPGRRLKLRAEMKMPGAATLTFDVLPEGAGSRLVQTAEFTPDGLAGRLYWYALLPFHALIFGGMLRRIARPRVAAPSDSRS